MKTAVHLLSSGLDSLTALSEAVKYNRVILNLTIDYGQKSAQKEIEYSKKISRFYKIKHQVITLPWYKKIITSSLVSPQKKIPKLHSVQEGNHKTAKAVWVPNRNGLLLNIAAAVAESRNAEFIIAGFNAEEAQTFPDNSKKFCETINHSFSFSTLNKVKVKNYFVEQCFNKGLFINLDIFQTNSRDRSAGGFDVDTNMNEC